MSEKISIQFEDIRTKSAIFFSHTDGPLAVKEAKRYVKALKDRFGDYNDMTPLSRLEADSVMFNFVCWVSTGDQFKFHDNDDLITAVMTYRLTDKENDRDHGHHIISCRREKDIMENFVAMMGAYS